MSFSCLAGIYIVADFVGHLSDFMDRSPNDRAMWQHLWTFYGARIPWFFDLSGRLVALLSVVFVISLLQRHGEMTALEAAGISRWRIVQPLIWAAAMVAIVSAANREWMIPRVREILCQSSSDGHPSRPRAMVPRYDPDTNVLFDGKEILASENRIQNVALRLPIAWPSIGQYLHAESATFLPPDAARPSGYLLQGLEHAGLINDAPSLPFRESVLVYAPADTPWLEPGTCFVVCRLPIEAFQNGQRWRLYNSTWVLWRALRTGALENSPDLQLTIHSRLLQPFLDTSLIFIGVPFVLPSQRRHFFSAAAKSLLIGGAFCLVTVTCHSLGLQGFIDPSLAAWLPLLIFVPLAVLVSKPFSQ